jgi:hypothetical protein
MNLFHRTVPMALAVLASIGVSASASQDPPRPVAKAPDMSGLHAFDLRAGLWHAHHRYLKDRLAGSHTWIEFDGTCDFRLLMDGRANEDDNVFDKPTGIVRGVTLRAYDPKNGEWSLWWLDGRKPSKLDVPVVGRFVDGTGRFYSDDTLRGRKIRVRFTWSRITATTAHWEQAFSADGGKTWETNWITDFTPAKPAR